MKKKIITLLFAIVASTGICFASTEVDGIWYEFDIYNRTATVTYRGQDPQSYNEYSGSIVIPSSVSYNGSTYSVISIGTAFCGCSSLISVSIPNSVTSIGQSAFSGCSRLTSIEIPNSVTSIERSAFSGCSGLTSIEIPNSVTSIGQSAFSGCSGLSSVTIGNSVTSIGSYAFDNCNSLTSVTIPNSVTSIGDGAFWGCSGLTSIEIPNSVTSIGQSAFRSCSNLGSFSIGNGVTSIGGYAFSDCSSLTSVIISNSVTSIGSGAFSGCSSLTSVIWNAKNCGDFSSTNLHSDTPFYYYDYYSSYNNFDIRPQITSITFGEEVEHIPAYLCWKLTNLTSINIPSSVTSIGQSAFAVCSNLTSVHIGDIATWCAIAFANVESNPLHFARHPYHNDTEITNLVIPDGVTNIGAWAFENCNSLTSVTIPNSVAGIGNSAFSGCTMLQYLTLGTGVNSIGDNAFNGSTYLVDITAKMALPPTINANVFGNCGDLSGITLNVPQRSMAQYRKTNVWKDFYLQAADDNTANYSITFRDKDSEILESDFVSITVPDAPVIDGFTFVMWQVVAGDLANGISVQAVYNNDALTSAPAVFTNPSNPTQKLIREGNVYVLHDNKTYTISGVKVD